MGMVDTREINKFIRQRASIKYTISRIKRFVQVFPENNGGQTFISFCDYECISQLYKYSFMMHPLYLCSVETMSGE